ncbi:hypothetical protein SAMN03080615_04358 [Amphritea atlantica]|uniref:Uncharacterized protein n=1 Tax=Amphritea atlantica TaxID=355243 RepID=A0A1H9MB60_9GAMM|nr:hypothetical protein SAMN03080615_04358 [Amphritea atlantica]
MLQFINPLIKLILLSPVENTIQLFQAGKTVDLYTIFTHMLQ